MESYLRTYQQLPIIKLIEHKFSRGFSYSYGVIPYCQTTKRWFIIRRKHNYGYLKLIWGDYVPATLKNMVLSLSNDDANVIEKCLLDPEYYYQKYSESVDIFIEERFTRVCQRLIANRDIISSLLSARQQDKKIHTGEWTWTKGMKEVYDFTPFDAALREFREETGILEIPSYTADNNEIETRYIVNNREYINVFWICKFDQEFTANIDTDNMEVCDSGWFDAGQINELISPLCSESFHIALDRV